MKQCMILTSHFEGSDLFLIDTSKYDAIFCADGGLEVAEKLHLLGDLPVYLIGDYDSGSMPTEAEREAAKDLIILPTVKDMTDSEAAIDFAVSEGFDHIHVYGGLGGRFDHSMGNLGMLAKYAKDLRVEQLCFEDGQNLVYMKAPGSFRIPAKGEDNRFHYFGLIAYGGSVEGLTITGAKYQLSNHLLTPDTTLGVSNEVAAGSEFAEVAHTDGLLLVIQSNDA